MVPESLEFTVLGLLDFLEVPVIVALILGLKDAGAFEKDPLTAHRNLITVTKGLIHSTLQEDHPIITSDFDAPS